MKKLVALFLFLFSLTVILTGVAGGPKDLVASLAELPGLAETPEKGAFVDLVKAIDEVYTEGKITIQVVPFARSVQSVMSGTADFHIPCLKHSLVDVTKLPYRFATDKMGTVAFVIYSRADKPVAKKELNDAIGKKGAFPYKIALAGGTEDAFPFPGETTNSLESALKRVDAGRLDALVWAQEEPDIVLRQLKLKSLLRAHWGSFDDGFIIPKGARGDEIDKVLSSALKKLRASGRLEKLYAKIHLPYTDWQPSKMGW